MFKNTHLFIYSGIFIDAKHCCRFPRQHRSVPYIGTFKLWTLKDSNVCSHVQSRVWYMLLHDCALVCFTVRYCIEYSNTLCLCLAQDVWKQLWKQWGYSQYFYSFQGTVSSVQSLSHVQLFGVAATPWTAARQASLSANSWSLLRLMFIESVMPSNHLIPCHPLLLLPSIFPSIMVFSNESAFHIRWCIGHYCTFQGTIL